MGNMFRDRLSQEAADRYKRIIGMLKVGQQDVQILHRYLVGSSFLSVHGLLEDAYKEMAEMIDEMAEIGITLGVKEPSIVTATQYAGAITVEERSLSETLTSFCEILEGIYEEMDAFTEKGLAPSDVTSKIDEYKLKIREFAAYKANQILKGVQDF